MTPSETDTKRRALAARVVARLAPLAAISASIGCSVVSGWNDLQNGVHTDAGGASIDASAPPVAIDSGAVTDSADGAVVPGTDSGAPPPDSSAPGSDASSVDLTVACGASRCAVGEGCCASILGGKAVCQSASQSCTPPMIFASCSDSAQCAISLGHAAQCCEETGTSSIPSVSCRGACTSSGKVVCDPTFAMPGCDAGQTCMLSSDGFGFNVCQ
jgi:hypothetical protein